jgi:hypothetical protein
MFEAGGEENFEPRRFVGHLENVQEFRKAHSRVQLKIKIYRIYSKTYLMLLIYQKQQNTSKIFLKMMSDNINSKQ